MSTPIQNEIKEAETKLSNLRAREAELYTWMAANSDRKNFDDVRSEWAAVTVKIETTIQKIAFMNGGRQQPPTVAALNSNRNTFNSHI
jgi:hypothetical protein